MFHTCISFLILLVVQATTFASPATTEITLRGDRLSGVVLPVLPRASDIEMKSLSADVWTVDDTKRLILDENITIKLGAFTFNADKASIWINRLDTDAGLVSQIAVFLPSFSKSSKHGSMTASGRNLLIVGSTLGSVTLDVALMNQKRPNKSNQFVKTSQARLAGYLKNLIDSPPQVSTLPIVIEGAAPLQIEESVTTQLDNSILDRPWLQKQTGFLSLAADHVELQTNDVENAVTVIGNVDLSMHSETPSEDLQMSAAKGVIFLNPGSLRDIASGSVDLSEIHGVYLEGNVVIHANQGDYLVRAPQVYYDFVTGKAIMLEAVLRTYIKDGKVPLYIRADELRQISENQWVGNGVQASTSSFVTPDLAIGSSNMEITQREDGNTYVKSLENALRLGGMPIAYWPKYEGVAGEIPLRRLKFGYAKDYGAIIETSWNLDTLLGYESPKGLKTELHLDAYTNRGVGVGFDSQYQLGRNKGIFDIYFLSDSGEQKTSSGRTIDVVNSQRGYALLKNETRLDDHWTLNSQLSYISDETYMSVWRRSEFKTNPEYETSIAAKYQRDNAAFTAMVKNDLNKFISTSWLLASRQYKVDKMPEIGYFRYGDSLFEGILNWSSESRFIRERMVFEPGTPADLGLRSAAFAFPDGTILGANQQISAPLVADGLRTDFRNRFVTRHEISAPISIGSVKIVPFASLQMQWGVDNDETMFPNEDRWFRTIGVRASTQFQRIYNNIDNDLLDLHRLRHVIEPYLTAWDADSDVDVTQTQQYDALIDNLSTGSAVWFGVRNRLQTWRGGPGRWYEVDWLTIDTAFIFANDGATQRYDNPQYFDWRPEYSSVQDAFLMSGKWQYSDSLAFIGNGSWELDGGTFSRGAFGVELDHGRDLRTFVEYRELGNSNDQFLSFGARYRLNKRYSLNVLPSWNFRTDELQTLRFNLTRHYPDFDLITNISYNEIQDETNYGLRLNLKKF